MDLLIHGLLPFSADFLAATVSGWAGFGGALILLPVLTFCFGLERALPILAAVQLVGNAARAAFGWAIIDWRAVVYFSLGSVPAGLIAASFLISVPVQMLRPLIGIVVFGAAVLETAVVFKKLPAFLSRFKPPETPGIWLTAAGMLVAVASGIGGTTGPLPNAFFLRLGLSAGAYIASEAAAMGILHAAKITAFGLASWIGMADLGLCAVLAVAMIFGTWCGKIVTARLAPERYRQAVAVWMLIAAMMVFFLPAERADF